MAFESLAHPEAVAIVDRIRDELGAWENRTQVGLVFCPELPTQYFLAHAFPDIRGALEELSYSTFTSSKCTFEEFDSEKLE